MSIKKYSSARVNAVFKPKVCSECGKEFNPLSGAAIRCPKCRMEYNKQKSKERLMKNENN